MIIYRCGLLYQLHAFHSLLWSSNDIMNTKCFSCRFLVWLWLLLQSSSDIMNLMKHSVVLKNDFLYHMSRSPRLSAVYGCFQEHTIATFNAQPISTNWGLIGPRNTPESTGEKLNWRHNEWIRFGEYGSVYYAVAQDKIYFQIYIYPKILIKHGNRAKNNPNRVIIDVALCKPFFVRVVWLQ